MGVSSEDAVVIRIGKKVGDPSLITVNCPDKIGLGCDLCRTVLEFGLRITRGGNQTTTLLSSFQNDPFPFRPNFPLPFPSTTSDLSVDGMWCLVLLWVVPRQPWMDVGWDGLKNRLMSLCPSNSLSYYLRLAPPPKDTPIYLLEFFCRDRKGLLHDVTHVLCELDLLIQKVKVSTTPDGRVVDLFYITDGLELMHTVERQDETCSRLDALLGDSCERCELQLAWPKYETFQQGLSSTCSASVEELCSCEMTKIEKCLKILGPDLTSVTKAKHSKAFEPDLTKIMKATINIDNSLSPAHTLLQLHSVDQKGLLYDILRTLKDRNMQISYGRFLSDMKEGSRDIDLFVQQDDGKKIIEHEKQEALCSHLRMEMLHPLRVKVINRGPDTELLVANPVELCGKGRPRVFYDVTLALKTLGICIFLAEIGRHSTAERQWEVYRFLLEESQESPLANDRTRNKIVDTVRKTIMGW